jgi:hypothetical protein
MPKIQIALAPDAVRAGALGVGENHTKAAGKHLVAKLIDAGLVRNLFIEIPEFKQNIIDRAAAVRGQGIGEVMKVLGDLDSMACPAFPLYKLVAIAIMLGVRVICADDKIVMKGGASGYMERRNKTTVNILKNVTGANSPTDPEAVGSVLLGGALHYKKDEKEPSTTIPEMFAGLSWVDCSWVPNQPAPPPPSAK